MKKSSNLNRLLMAIVFCTALFPDFFATWVNNYITDILGKPLPVLNALCAAEKKDESMEPAKHESWKQWLDGVDIIMSSLERSVAKKLKTVEEQSRFQELFWKARDSDPNTPQNEFQAEFNKRVYYAKTFFAGAHTDRGKMYVLLGEPQNKSTFSGYDTLVECEVWSYENKDLPELPPFFNLIFFKPHDVGDFQLYYPGIHKPRDLLSPNYYENVKNSKQIQQYLKSSSVVLADAALSIIPGEGSAIGGPSLASSNLVMNRIYALPEHEAEIGYVRTFLPSAHSVQVTHSTNIIRGFAYISVMPNKGIPFLHYAMMPDTLSWKNDGKDSYVANIRLNISVEDLNGHMVFQNTRQIPLTADNKKKESIDNQRIVFRDFAPIIEGEFNVIISFMNETSQEFFTHIEKITVPRLTLNNDKTVLDRMDKSGNMGGSTPVLLPMMGFQLKELPAPPNPYLPFIWDSFLVLTDPRFTFSQKDSMEGIILSDQLPEVLLKRINESSVYPISVVSTGLNFTGASPGNSSVVGNEKKVNLFSVYKFKALLTDVKDGNYMLLIKNKLGQTVSRKVHVLPGYINVQKPFAMEKPEPQNNGDNYVFIRAQEYLAVNQPDGAIECFNALPAGAWNGNTIPIIANAYFKKKDYVRVIDLLERDMIKKEFPVLSMLANAYIATKAYPKAIQSLEKLRAYGDTAEINQMIASVYLLMGNKEKADSYLERSKRLKAN